MSPSRPDDTITGYDELIRLHDDLRRLGLMDQVKKDLEAAALPIWHEIRANARAIPSKGKKHTGLRRNLAAATDIKLGTRGDDLRLKVGTFPELMPANQRNMPAKMNSTKFRHPVFGDREVWVTQKGGRYFSKGSRKRKEAIRAAIDRAVETVRQKLIRGGRR